MAGGREATRPCKGYPKGAKPTAITPILSYLPPQAGRHICAELVGASWESKLSDFKNTVISSRLLLTKRKGAAMAAVVLLYGDATTVAASRRTENRSRRPRHNCKHNVPGW